MPRRREGYLARLLYGRRMSGRMRNGSRSGSGATDLTVVEVDI